MKKLEYLRKLLTVCVIFTIVFAVVCAIFFEIKVIAYLLIGLMVVDMIVAALILEEEDQLREAKRKRKKKGGYYAYFGERSQCFD